MEPLLIIVPGAIGGLLLAFLIARIHFKAPPVIVRRRLAPPNPGLINIAQIQIEGIGGLGLVLAVLAVAISNPGVREALILSFLLGASMATALIALRRRSVDAHRSDGPDDRSTLHLEDHRPDPGGHTPKAGVRYNSLPASFA